MTAALLSGGEVKLCAGTFAGSFVVSVNNTAISAVGNGTDPKKASIVDAQSAGRAFLINPDLSSSFSNLRITNGLAPAGPTGGGGGIAVAPKASLISAPIVVDKVIFEANSAESAGGLGTAGPVTISNSQFINNKATGVAGAPGAGLNLFAVAAGVASTVTNCTFTGNVAAGIGAAMFIRNQSVNITGATITGNTAENGGGIYADGTSPTIVNLDSKTTVSTNTATASGPTIAGGIAVGSPSTTVNLNGASVSGNTPKNCDAVTGC